MPTYTPTPITPGLPSDANADVNNELLAIANIVNGALGAENLAAAAVGVSALAQPVLNEIRIFFNVRTHGAVGDGTTDDTSALQAAIDAATAAGGGRVFLPKGTYLVSAMLTVPSNVVLVGAGAQFTIVKAGANGVSPIRLNAGASYNGVQSLTVDGNKAGITGTSHGIYCLSDSARIYDCRITAVRNNGIEVEGGDQVRIAFCDFASIDGSAVRVVASANDAHIASNSVSGCHNGFFMYDNGTGASSNRAKIIGNVIESCTGTNGALAQDGGIAVNGCEHTLIQANIVRSNTGRGIHVFGNCSGAVIAGNIVVDCGVTNQVSGIDVGDAGDTNFLVFGNQSWRSGAAGMFVAGLQRSLIFGNMCVNNGLGSADAGNRNGITINLTGAVKNTDNLFIGNHCFDSQATKTQEYGIREWQGAASDYTDNVYMGNNCRQNKTGGMLLVSTTAVAQANRGFNPQGAAAITVTASPFLYTNNDNVSEAVYLRGGTISDINKNGRTIFSASPATVILEPGEAVTVTYSAAPTMEKDRK